MSNHNFKIEKGNSFNSIEANLTLPEKQKAIDYYHKKMAAARELQENIPVFLDANVLLRGYSISPKNRAFLHEFFLERKEQIVITKQAHQEFIINEASVKHTYAQLPEAQISDLNNPLASLLLELGIAPEVGEGEDQSKTAEAPEELSDVYTHFELIDNLSSEEKKFLVKEFDVLKRELASQKNKINKSNNIFPGMGDIKEKPHFPYGDYFLYHEMLKYALEKNTDVVFLTFDVAKEDWLKKNKEPHAHYIHKTFALSQRAIFILDANKYFEELFSTSFEPIVAPEKKVERYIVKSAFEEALVLSFTKLERTIRRIANKAGIVATKDISVKQVLDEMNYDGIIPNDSYYELIGIWSIRDALIHGDIDLIRRQYTPAELEEILEAVRRYNREIGIL